MGRRFNWFRSGGLLACALALQACGSDGVTDPSGSGAVFSKIDGKRLDPSKLAVMRGLSQGCSFTVQEPSGLVHTASVPRKFLPFQIPKLREKKGESTGRLVTVFVGLKKAKVAVSVNCIIPENMTEADLTRKIVASANSRAWSHVWTRLERSEGKQPNALVELSPEAREVRMETVGMSSNTSATGGATGIHLDIDDCDMWI